MTFQFLHIMFRSVFESFSLATTCSRIMCYLCKKYFSRETVVRHSDTGASPAELVLHYLYLNTGCVGLHEYTGIGAVIFPSDTKYLSEAILVEFLLGLQMTLTNNLCLAPVE